MDDRNDPRRRIEQNLRAALDTLHADMTRVELWALALSGFSEPVPDYDLAEKFRLQRAANSVSKAADLASPKASPQPPRRPLKFD